MKAIYNYIVEICNVWYLELRYMLLDKGMILFLVLLPLAYPVLYSWIYNNEVVREVPVVVVDKSNSSLSRKFIHMYDASPDVRVAYRATSLSDAQNIVGHQKAYGVLYFPEDFARKINRMEQGTVGVYCDMSLMLAYKNIYQTATTISGMMGAGLQTKLLGNYTRHEDVVATQPLAYDAVQIFNPTGGYGNFIIPGVLILILQQTLLLGMGMTCGTLREKTGRIILRDPRFKHLVPVIAGKWMAYMLEYLVLSAYILLIIPHLFGFVSMVHAKDLLLLVIPYLMSCIFFGMSTMSIVRQREDVMLLVVFSSVPLLFAAGVSWPASSIPPIWEYYSYCFPSTLGIKAFIAMNSMGARLDDVQPWIIGLWIQAFVYLITTAIVYHRELKK